MVTEKDIDIFKDRDEQIKALINSTAQIIGKEEFIINDGVSFPEIYLNTSPKIMWILKEPYELHGDYSWTVGRIYKQDPKTKGILKIMHMKRIATINYCIMHNIEEYKDTIKIEDDELVDAIQSMAIININKIAAAPRSPEDLSPQYKIWKDVLNLQLNLYNPDIIICGNTLQYFSDDIKYNNGIKNELVGMNGHHYFCFENKIFINAFHPSFDYGKCDDNSYINEILNAINVWENYKKTANKSQMSQDCLRFTPFEGSASAKPQSG